LSAEDSELKEFVGEYWPGNGELAFEALPVDGSDRRFWRVRRGDASRVVIDHPGGRRAEPGLSSENDAYEFIARHLDARGLAVPRVLAHDRGAGRLLVTDLGERQLMAAASEAADDPEALFEIYLRVIQLLVDMQLGATEGFDPSWCHQTTRFTAELFREREGGYFASAFVRGLLKLDLEDTGLDRELDQVARRAAGSGIECFVHRDFQSRNILLTDAGPALVDFQSARLGPPTYDLAAVVLDPYVDLPDELREVLIEVYLDLTRGRIWPDDTAFRESWRVVALSRTMQTLGAFGYLTTVKNRPHFREHVPAGIRNLTGLLADPLFEGFPVLRRLAGRIQDRGSA
jgi:aminoglycoside/choline kinase family phosphotransferase